MERQSKTRSSWLKTLKTKKSAETPTNHSKRTPENNLISRKEVYAFESKPLIEDDIMKTPKRSTSRYVVDSFQGSPQCRVGWDDGSDSNLSMSMESPVYIPSVDRKIRRCPDELYKRAKKKIESKQKIMENDCDEIQECLTWAKNLQNSLSKNIPDQKKTRDEDSAIDILDDSTDELMVLCSQAVEENFARSSDNINGKRPLILDTCQAKKKKLNESNPTTTNSIITSLIPVDNPVSKVLQFDDIDVIAVDAKIATNNQSDNNNSRVDNFNYQRADIKNLRRDESKNIMKKANKSDKIVDSMDLFIFDDDEFNSIDFNYIDQISSTHSQNDSPAEKSTVTTCNPKPTPPVRYTKEQIEQRRLEARKKLLFKSKNRSM